MKPELAAMVTDTVREQAARLFDMDPVTLVPLDAFENVVYECRRGNESCILRISHSSHRTREQVESELHWVNYLASHGVSVSRPLQSASGSYVETLDGAESQYVVAAFEKAPGKKLKREELTDAMTVNRGRMLGKIHALSKDYDPPDHIRRQNHWHEGDDFANFGLHMPASDRVVIDRFAELVEELLAIPRWTDDYGLIHFDAHTGNICFDGDSPTLFDFDDCAYDFFVSDIGIALFYALFLYPEDQDPAAYAMKFLRYFFAGYQEEMPLDPRWPSIIPMILKRREMILYNAIYRGMDSDNRDEWSIRYLRDHRERIVKRIPFADLDFERLAETM